VSFPSLSTRRIALLPLALSGSCLLRCQLGSSIQNGCCHLSIELEFPSPETFVPPRPHSHPNSAMGYQLHFLTLLLSQDLAAPGYFATARRPPH
jgi:hypothetical protein